MTEKAISNLKAGSPDKILTACPLCRTTFSRYSDIPVIDIAEAVNENIN
jgi:Fe-S oxidoreductase